MTGTGSQTLLRAPAAAAGTLRCCPRLRARLGSAAPGLLSPLRGVNASPGMEQKSRALSGQRADRVIYLGGKAGPRDIVLREKNFCLSSNSFTSSDSASERRNLSAHEILSRRGSVGGFSLQTCFYTPAGSRGSAEHRGLSLGAIFRPGPVCGRARLLRAGAGRARPGFPCGEMGSGVRSGRPGPNLPSLLPGTASPSRQRRELQLGREQTTAELETENSGWKEAGTVQFAVGQEDLPSFLDGEVPVLYPAAATPRASLGDRHSPSRAAGPGVPWEEENEEEDNLSHPGQRMFPVPRLKARERANSLAQLFGVFPSYMKLLTLKWRLELKM